jgi:hypothetical protein
MHWNQSEGRISLCEAWSTTDPWSEAAFLLAITVLWKIDKKATSLVSHHAA